MALQRNMPLHHRWIINRLEQRLDPPRVNEDYEEFELFYTTVFHRNLTWQVKLIFNGSNNPDHEWISLQMRLLTNQIRVNLNFKTWMVNFNDVWIRMNADEFVEMDDTLTYNIKNFINKDGLHVNHLEYTPNDMLTLICQFDIASCFLIPLLPFKSQLIVQEDYSEYWSSDEEDSAAAPKLPAKDGDWATSQKCF